MDLIEMEPDPGWVPDECALPSAEQPFRATEFDDLFAEVIGVRRIDATHAMLTLAGSEGLAARAHDLTERETACCSFFTFTIEPADPAGAAPEVIRMRIAVPAAYALVLTALVDRAEQQANR